MQIYAVVNYRTCGFCRKFRPVLESVIKSMNPKAQKMIEIVDLETPKGKAKQAELKFKGGIPCIIAHVDGQEVHKEPGYKDTTRFSQLLIKLWAQYA
ncbi:predicted protein [Cyanophage PSS2]|uniref:thioredoxin n=1 Tax=Cyanophage PSS2 TaxID=658401 RepID=UPI0001B03FE0|nr:thioredoxin [Cyanophage PSS2]ACT65572.1 thioredoxin [Cyanophage PSS2]ACY75716.1 predicted protein [Cyanophage PSS2]